VHREASWTAPLPEIGGGVVKEAALIACAACGISFDLSPR